MLRSFLDKAGDMVSSAACFVQKHAVGCAIAIAAVGAAVIGVPDMASAMAVPVAGDLGYEVYEMVISNGLNGPLGYTGAGILVVGGFTQMNKSWLFPVSGLAAATAIINTDGLVQAAGALI